MAATTRISRKAAFAVFSDDDVSVPASSSASGHPKSLSKPAVPSQVPSKRARQASSHASSSRLPTGISAKAAASSFSVFCDADAIAEKENINVFDGKRAGLGSKGVKKVLSAKNGTQSSTKTHVQKGEKAFLGETKQRAKASMWAGKQPFEDASPDKAYALKQASKAKTIYDLPSIEPSFAPPLSTSSLRAPPAISRSRAVGGGAVSRPNKKPIPNLSVITSTCNQERAADAFASPARAIIAAQANRRAKDLTESPLADVTAAYIGNGRFSCSPTADSGYIPSSREASASPIPTRSDLQHNTPEERFLVEEDFQTYADNGMRRGGNLRQDDKEDMDSPHRSSSTAFLGQSRPLGSYDAKPFSDSLQDLPAALVNMRV